MIKVERNIKKMVGQPQKHLDKVYNYLEDVGIETTLPHRIAWTEFLPDGGRIFHYTTEDEYRQCKNEKRTA